MKVVSLNANGIRSAIKKGFYDWLAKENFDVICIQETKAQLTELQTQVALKNYHLYFSDAQKKGYSGVAIFCKQEPDEIKIGFGEPLLDMDNEGRYVAARFGKVWVASVYLPSGSSGDVRQNVKFDCLNRLSPVMKTWLESGFEYILCGDFNIAHKNIDLKNWKANQKTSGFLPEERAWFDQIIADGWVDAFRVLNQNEGEYSWWSSRSKTAYENNIGWRIDYHIITPNLTNTALSTYIYRDEKFSDHAPVIVEYKL